MKGLKIYVRTVICSLRNMFCFDTEHICFMNELIFPTLDSDSTWLIYFLFFPDSIVNIPRKISSMGDFLVFLLLYAFSEICSVLMRNIYVSWKFKHFVPDYGKKKFPKVENCLCFGIELINICFISSDSPRPYSAKYE